MSQPNSPAGSPMHVDTPSFNFGSGQIPVAQGATGFTVNLECSLRYHYEPAMDPGEAPRSHSGSPMPDPSRRASSRSTSKQPPSGGWSGHSSQSYSNRSAQRRQSERGFRSNVPSPAQSMRHQVGRRGRSGARSVRSAYSPYARPPSAHRSASPQMNRSAMASRYPRYVPDEYGVLHSAGLPTFEPEANAQVDQAAVVYGYPQRIHRNVTRLMNPPSPRSYRDRRLPTPPRPVMENGRYDGFPDPDVERLLSGAGRVESDDELQLPPLKRHASRRVHSTTPEDLSRAMVRYAEPYCQPSEGELDGDVVGGAEEPFLSREPPAMGHVTLGSPELRDHLREMGVAPPVLMQQDASPEELPRRSAANRANRAADRPSTPPPGTSAPLTPHTARSMSYDPYNNLLNDRWTLEEDRALFRAITARVEKSWATIISQNPCLAKRSEEALKRRINTLKQKKKLEGNRADGFKGLDPRLTQGRLFREGKKLDRSSEEPT